MQQRLQLFGILFFVGRRHTDPEALLYHIGLANNQKSHLPDTIFVTGKNAEDAQENCCFWGDSLVLRSWNPKVCGEGSSRVTRGQSRLSDCESF
jgi:hypothetical protein